MIGVVLIDVKNYFQPLKALIDHIVKQGFARPEVTALHTFAATPEDAMHAVSSRLAST